MRFIKIALLVGLVYLGYLLFSTGRDINESFDYGSRAIPLLNAVSSDWRLETLKEQIDPIGFGKNAELYQKMLLRSAHLGAFRKCTDLSVGTPTELEVEGAKAIVGDCSFENGLAYVAIIFLEIKGETKVVSLIIRPIAG